MALIEHDLFRGRIDRVQIAIDRLKMFEPQEGYYLAYSGGKDSDTILASAKMSGVTFDAHYHLTTVDPPELVYHVRKHPEVEVSKPKKNMWQLIQYKKIPPTRVVRYCCRELKENGGTGRTVITGVRASESIKRHNRKMTEICYTDITKKYLHVIIDWTENDVWEFLKKYNISYCKLYNEGYKRLGCVLCPLKSQKERMRDLQKYPRIAKAYKNAIIRAFDLRERASEGILSGDELYKWWISGRTVKAWGQKTTLFTAYE